MGMQVCGGHLGEYSVRRHERNRESAVCRGEPSAFHPTGTAIHSHQQSIGRTRAIALFETKWWLTRTTREVAKFQLFTAELCLPFEIFHRALEEALGRPIWIHEFGLNVEALVQEFLDERDAPTLSEILELIPADKAQHLFVEGRS